MFNKNQNSRKNISKTALQIIAKRTYASNHTQNFMISIAAIFVIILITAACSVFYNFQRFSAMQERKEKGTIADIVLTDPQESQLVLLEKSDMVQAPLHISYKLGRLAGNIGQSGLSLSLYTEKNWDIYSEPLFSDIQGHYPLEDKEIMMSTWLLKRLGIEPVIGAEITLYTAWEDRDLVQQEKFILSGYYTDTSYIDTASKQKVFLSEKALTQHQAPVEFVGFSLTAGQFQKKLALIRKQILLNEQQIFLILGGQEIQFLSKNTGFALVVILFFMLDGFLIIYNINTISAAKEIAFYGLLKTIGLTPKQLKRIIYCQMKRILFNVMPIGLFLGCFITQWIVPLILGSMLEGFSKAQFHWIIPIASAFFSGVMIYASYCTTAKKVMEISPIDTQRYVQSGWKWKTKSKGVHTKLCWMGLRNVFRKPQKACLVIGTFFLSSTAFLLCMTILRGMSLDEFINYNTAHDIALYNSMSRASFSPVEEQSFTPEILEKMQYIEGIESLGITTVVSIYEHYSDAVYGDWLEIKNEFERSSGMEVTEPNIWIDNPKAAFWGLLIGIDSDIIAEYNQSSQTPINIEGFEKGDFLLTTDMNGNGLHLGSTITFSVMESDKQFALPIGGQIPLARDGMNSGAAPWLVVSNKVIDRYSDKAIIYSVKIDNYSEYEESVLEQVIELTDNIPAITRTSKIELAKSLEKAKSALSKLSAFLTIVLFTVGCLNFVNTISVNILGRQREFATMEAIGASRRQMRHLLSWEGAWYFIFTLGLSATIGTGIDFLIFRVIRENLGFGIFYYPALPMIIYMMLSFLLCICIPTVIYTA